LTPLLIGFAAAFSNQHGGVSHRTGRFENAAAQAGLERLEKEVHLLTYFGGYVFAKLLFSLGNLLHSAA